MTRLFEHNRFQRHDELVAALEAAARAHPRWLHLQEIGRSHEGRALLLLTLSDRAAGPAADKPALWLDGTIHATELSACTACLYFIDWMIERRDSDAGVARALAQTAFYVCPRIAVDAADAALQTPVRLLRSATRSWPFAGGEADEAPAGLLIEDIDGDGRIAQMRLPDPHGAWKEHPEDPRLLVRREPDDWGGRYWRVMPEGRIAGEDLQAFALGGSGGHVAALDLNRNFPAGWRPQTEQAGAGAYPASEPEVRAVVDFIVAHPQIGIGVSFHTMAGALLRPFADQPDTAFAAADLRVYRKMGSKGEALTGYPAISIFHDFAYQPGQHIGGTFDWLYQHRGAFQWTVEIWNPRKEAGIDNRDWIGWNRDHSDADALAMLRWSDSELRGEGHLPWRPFEHPQLGPVELGGWHRMGGIVNPPPHRLEAEVARFPPWLLWLSHGLPRLVLRQAAARRADGLPDTWWVELDVQNAGWLPTAVTAVAVKQGVSPGLAARIELPPGTELVSGPPTQRLGELDGWSHKNTGLAEAADPRPHGDHAVARWLVHAPGGSTSVPVALSAWHPRAGRVACTVVLGPGA